MQKFLILNFLCQIFTPLHSMDNHSDFVTLPKTSELIEYFAKLWIEIQYIKYLLYPHGPINPSAKAPHELPMHQ